MGSDLTSNSFPAIVPVRYRDNSLFFDAEGAAIGGMQLGNKDLYFAANVSQ
jgi:hypothetical protein